MRTVSGKPQQSSVSIEDEMKAAMAELAEKSVLELVAELVVLRRNARTIAGIMYDRLTEPDDGD